MMKVPPLKINLKNIEKHKEHKKHKKHKKHKRHHHSKHHQHQQDKPATPNINNNPPPTLEPVELPENEEPIHYYPRIKSPEEQTPIAEPEAATDAAESAATTTTNDASQAEAPTIPQPVAVEPATTSGPNELNKSNEAGSEPAGAEVKLQSPLQQDQPMDVDKAVEPPAESAADARSAVVVPAAAEPDKMETLNETQAQNLGQAKANLSYLKLADDGVVRLNIITTLPAQPEDTNERILNLEKLCGELNDGIDVLPSEIDVEECREILHAKPVESVEPSPFGSYLPTQDSTFANLTKEDSETLLEVYGSNDTCYQYAKSLQDYARGTNYLMTMVDSLLDLLTDGKHRKEVVPIRKKQEELVQDAMAQAQETLTNGQGGDKAKESEPEQVQDGKPEGKADGDNIKQEEGGGGDKVNDEVQADLDSIDDLLARLKEVQEKRLSSCPSPVEPGDEESRLADEILSKMTKLIKEKTKPQDIIDSKSVFKALGIEMNCT